MTAIFYTNSFGPIEKSVEAAHMKLLNSIEKEGGIAVKSKQNLTGNEFRDLFKNKRIQIGEKTIY